MPHSSWIQRATMEMSWAPELLCTLSIIYSLRPPYRWSCASDGLQWPVPWNARRTHCGLQVAVDGSWPSCVAKEMLHNCPPTSCNPGKKIKSPVVSTAKPTLSLNLNSFPKLMTHYALSVNLPDALDVNGASALHKISEISSYWHHLLKSYVKARLIPKAFN